MGGKVRNMFGGQLPMQVSVAPTANEDNPVAVDLLVVYDKKVLETLLKMPASDWFSKKQQLLNDHQDVLSRQGWEWIPGQVVEPVSIGYRSGAVRVVLFADYGTEGEHRATVDPQQPFRLVLGEREISVEKLQ